MNFGRLPEKKDPHHRQPQRPLAENIWRKQNPWRPRSLPLKNRLEKHDLGRLRILPPKEGRRKQHHRRPRSRLLKRRPITKHLQISGILSPKAR